MYRLVFAFSFLLFFCPHESMAQGRLERVRFATGQSGSDLPGSASLGSSGSWNNFGKIWWSNDNTLGENLVGDLFLGTMLVAGVTAPLWAPYAFLDEGAGKFPHYPYADSAAGYMLIGHNNTERFEEEGGYVKPWSVRLSIADATDFNGLNRIGGQLFLDTQSRVGILSNWNYYQEYLGAGRYDHTWLTDHNFTFRIAQAENLQMHVGAGLRYQIDPIHNDFGSNFLYRADWYPLKPVHLTGTASIGNLGNAMVVQANLQCGFSYRFGEAYFGYEFLRIGRVDLQGPFLGIRLWY